MNKLFYIAFLFCLFACKHPESKIFERYKEVTIVEETKTEILKDGVKLLTVASDARWVMNNDTEGFVKLSEDEQDDLMLIVLEFLATHKRDR